MPGVTLASAAVAITRVPGYIAPLCPFAANVGPSPCLLPFAGTGKNSVSNADKTFDCVCDPLAGFSGPQCQCACPTLR